MDLFNGSLPEYMLAIQRYKSLSKAAEALYISEPALNQQLKKFEKKLGEKLFMKSEIGLVPTDFGKIYISGAREYISVRTKEEAELNRILANDFKGQINVSFHENFYPFFEKNILPAFMEKYNDHILAVHATTGNVKHSIEDNLSDIGIIVSVGDAARRLPSLTLRKEPWVMILPKKYHFSERELSDTSRISQLPWLDAPKGSSIQLFGKIILNTAGIHPQYTSCSLDVRNYLHLLNEGVLAGALPLRAVDVSEKIEILPLPEICRWELRLVYQETVSQSPILNDLIRILVLLFDEKKGNHSILNAYGN